MKLPFELWSSSNPDAIKNICPDLGMREWNDLDFSEKQTIWLYLSNYGLFKKSTDIFHTIVILNEKYKRKSYGKNLLLHGGPHTETRYSGIYLSSCCLNISMQDFEQIFFHNDRDVVYEMLSLYVNELVDTAAIQNIDESIDKNIKDEIINRAYEKADEFSERFNDIFKQFSLNIVLTRNGIVFRQDKKITEDIYVPVLSYLSSKKWGPVNRDFSDAFRKFQEKTPQGYSGCITHAISALQGFLQILVYDKTGKGDLNDLILEAQNKKIIPPDTFSTKIFKDIQSILMQKRQESGDPHPKKEYANERSAKLVLNLIMIFIQHCVIKE